jgi:(p)ppGpp synthase/HD superfamily hydrolase
MRTDDLIELAKGLATAAHQGQLDKAGEPYLGHPARVADRVRVGAPDDLAAIAIATAWLHDVLEDTPTDPADLLAAGLPERVVDAVVALTKRAGETPAEYYARVRSDPLARMVKAADLADNTDPGRLAKLDQITAARLTAKYAAAREMLIDNPQFDSAAGDGDLVG